MKLKLFSLLTILSLALMLMPTPAQANSDYPRRYLGYEIDRCSNNKMLTLWDARGWEVNFGGYDQGWVYVGVGGGRFAWWCGGSEEWTTAPFYTEWVYVIRDANRKIFWKAYN